MIKILGVTPTYNVAEKIPYVMPYYERIGIDKLIVYDNYSTDNTVELLSKYPFVEIRYYETDSFDDDVILNIKNNAWKEYKDEYDWAIVCDFDEVLFSEKNFKDVLMEKRLEGKTYFKKIGLNLLSRNFPPINNHLIHENVGKGYLWDCDDNILGIWGNKTILFDMKNLELEYTEKGAHSCNFINGNPIPFDDDINFFHIKMIDFDYIIKQSIEYHERIKKHGITCYDFFIKNLSQIYEQSESRAIPVQKYINTPGEKLIPVQLVLIAETKCLNDGIKIINNLNRNIDRNTFYQIGVLFFNSSEEDYDYSYLNNYAFQNKIIPYISGRAFNDNTKNILNGYAYKFRDNHKTPNPWISFYNNKILENLKNPGLKKRLEEATLNNEAVTNFEGIHFERYETFIEKDNPTLGCYLIVKNEENDIVRCLNNIKNVCDEIVVVDTGSIDRTIELISTFPNVKLSHFKWINDFAAARNYAMKQMESDYIFSIDADESLTEELKNTLIHYKNNNFFGFNSINMYIRIDDSYFYLGGRQIVKNTPENIWKYKIHEKLFYDESINVVINTSDGFINHNPHDSKTNYNKYAEIYYNDINVNDVLNDENTAHYYFYQFFTLKDIDYFMSKRYLYNLFKTDKIISNTENQGFNLYESNWITHEEFIVNSLIGAYGNPNMVIKIYPSLKEEMPRYTCLKWCYDNNYVLSEYQYVDLAYLSYNFGLFKDFINLTKELVDKYPDSEIGQNNNAFIDNILNNLNNYVLIIDCSDGSSCLSSNISNMSQYFNTIYLKYKKDETSKLIINDNISLKIIYDDDEINTNKKILVINGNKYFERIRLKNIMQNLSYDKKINENDIYIK